MVTSILFGIMTLIVGYFSLFLKKPLHRALFYPLFVVLCIGTWNNTLGVALPNDMNLFHRKGKILAQQLIEDNAIYIWMIPEGETVPIAFKLPWVKDDAKKLHEAGKTHTGMKVELPSIKEKIAGKMRNITSEKNSKGDGDENDGKDGKEKVAGEKNGKLGHLDPTKALGKPIGNPIFYPDMNITNLPPKDESND